jgi:hypothetical protein
MQVDISVHIPTSVSRSTLADLASIPTISFPRHGSFSFVFLLLSYTCQQAHQEENGIRRQVSKAGLFTFLMFTIFIIIIFLFVPKCGELFRVLHLNPANSRKIAFELHLRYDWKSFTLSVCILYGRCFYEGRFRITSRNIIRRFYPQ